MMKYLALLLGINVGGKNQIKMFDLKTCFEQMGLRDVVTFIQSGNVLFSTNEIDVAALTEKIEKELSSKFNYKSKVVLVSHAKLKSVIDEAPKGFGNKPTLYRYDVIFLKVPLSSSEAMKSVSVKEGVDEAFEGKNVLYFSRLITQASQSHLSRIVSMPVYQNMTIRNWNTTTKLLTLMEKESARK